MFWLLKMAKCSLEHRNVISSDKAHLELGGFVKQLIIEAAVKENHMKWKPMHRKSSLFSVVYLLVESLGHISKMQLAMLLQCRRSISNDYYSLFISGIRKHELVEHVVSSTWCYITNSKRFHQRIISQVISIGRLDHVL